MKKHSKEEDWKEKYEQLNKSLYLFQQKSMEERRKLIERINCYDKNYVEAKKQIQRLQSQIRYKRKPQTFPQKEMKRLMEKFNVKSVAGGMYGDGFFECLKMFDKKLIKIE